MCETKYLIKLKHSPKYPAESSLMQNNSRSFSPIWNKCVLSLIIILLL